MLQITIENYITKFVESHEDWERDEAIMPNWETPTQNGCQIMGIVQTDTHIIVEDEQALENWYIALCNAYIIDGYLIDMVWEYGNGDWEQIEGMNNPDIITKTSILYNDHVSQLSGDDSYFDYGYGYILEIIETIQHYMK